MNFIAKRAKDAKIIRKFFALFASFAVISGRGRARFCKVITIGA